MADSIGYAVAMDHADAMYRVGERAVLTVTATNGAGEKVVSGTVKAITDNYGPKKFGTRTVDLSRENPFMVELALDEPGFARLQMEGGGRLRPFVWSVGFDAEKIVAGGEAPADFDAFWRESIVHLEATVPLDPRMTHVPERSKGPYDFYRISFSTFGGARVYGFLTVPKDKSKAKYPATVEVSSAGEGKWTIDTTGLPDRIKMYFTVHNFDPPATVEEVQKLHADLRQRLAAQYGDPSYAHAGLAKSPRDYYFYPVVLGINRAINWLWERPDVDRSRFGYEGGSQGGCFGWMLCGLNSKFTSAVLRVPAMSDARACLVGRGGSWPYPLVGASGEKYDTILRNIAYFDGASFAPRIKMPIRVVVGLADNTCPPDAVYATYNRLGSTDKGILNGIGLGHGGQTRKQSEEARAWQYGL